MKRQQTNEIECGKGYLAPFVSVEAVESSGILCSSKPESDYIEDMSTGNKFDNWI